MGAEEKTGGSGQTWKRKARESILLFRAFKDVFWLGDITSRTR